MSPNAVLDDHRRLPRSNSSESPSDNASADGGRGGPRRRESSSRQATPIRREGSRVDMSAQDGLVRATTATTTGRVSRQREITSCAECRRLKLKCDRQVPCANCVKRLCDDICPEGTRKRVMVRISALKENKKRKIDTDSQARDMSGSAKPDHTSGSTRSDSIVPEEALDDDGIVIGNTEPSDSNTQQPRIRAAERIDRQEMQRHQASGSSSWRPYEHTSKTNRSSKEIQTGFVDLDSSQHWEREQWDSGGASPKGNMEANAIPFIEGVSQDVTHESFNSLLVGSKTVQHDTQAAVVVQTEWNTQPSEQQYPSHLPLGAFPPEHGTIPYTAPPGILRGARSGWIDGLESQQQQEQPPPSTAACSALPGPRPTNQQGVGTLLIGRAGRSKFLGPTAGSEWLNDQEAGGDETDGSRMPSPEVDSTDRPSGPSWHPLPPRTNTFPFFDPSDTTTTRWLLKQVPDEDEAKVLVDCYFRHFAWHYNICPRPSFEPTLDAILDAQSSSNEVRVNAQQIALMFIVLAVGTLFNLEVLPHHPSAHRYFLLSQQSLCKGDFLNRNTVAGLQTVHIMAHYLLFVWSLSLDNLVMPLISRRNSLTEQGSSGDTAWPLWGLSVRMIYSMGLHRDGAQWNLPAEIVDDRRLVQAVVTEYGYWLICYHRRLFWETYTADVFQANCFSRPNAITPDQSDTLFPEEISQTTARGTTTRSGYFTAKFQLVRLAKRVLDEALRISPSTSGIVHDLWIQLRQFEMELPYQLRCRAALLALPSAYPNPEDAQSASPQVNKGQLQLTFQQHSLAVNISEAILFLQRPYFLKALHEDPIDPSRSQHGPAFLAVVERCSVIIAIVKSINELYPSACLRHWHLWYHTFSAAVCLGSLVLLSPRNVLASFALSQMDTSIALYSMAVNSRAVPRLLRNLQSLLQLRQKAWAANLQVQADVGARGTTANETADPPDQVTELLGWRTRLIERGVAGSKATTIRPSVPTAELNPAAEVSPFAQISRAISLAFQTYVDPSAANGQGPVVGPAMDFMDEPANDFLQQFWDPNVMAGDIATDFGAP